MTRVKPTVVVRALTFLREVFVAVVSCAAGGVAGYWVVIALCGVQEGRLPRLDEVVPVPFVPLFGTAMGAIAGFGVRASVGGIRRFGLWALGFFLGGAIAVPVTFIALLAYAMSGRPY